MVTSEPCMSTSFGVAIVPLTGRALMKRAVIGTVQKCLRQTWDKYPELRPCQLTLRGGATDGKRQLVTLWHASTCDKRVQQFVGNFAIILSTTWQIGTTKEHAFPISYKAAGVWCQIDSGLGNDRPRDSIRHSASQSRQLSHRAIFGKLPNIFWVPWCCAAFQSWRGKLAHCWKACNAGGYEGVSGMCGLSCPFVRPFRSIPHDFGI